MILLILPILSELLGRKGVMQVASPKPEAIRRFMKFIGDKKTALIAHNAAFDLRTLHQCTLVDAILKQAIRWSILKDFESRYRWMSMNEPWGLLLRFACTWVIMSVWNCWLLAQMKPAIAFGLLAEPRLTFSGIAECVEVVSQFSHSVSCLFALASQFGHKPWSNLPLQVVTYGQLISLD